MSPQDFTAAGRLLGGGDGWKREVGRLLGPLHPDGPRDALDASQVDRWSSGKREVLPWVEAALLRLLGDLADEAEREAAAARAVLARIAKS